MTSCESLAELKEWLDEYYNIKGRRNFNDQLQTVAYIMEEFEYLINENKTQKNCIILLLGKLIIENDTSIHIYQYNLILKAIEETLKDYKTFDLTPEEKQEIYDIALLLKERINNLKVEFN